MTSWQKLMNERVGFLPEVEFHKNPWSEKHTQPERLRVCENKPFIKEMNDQQDAV